MGTIDRQLHRNIWEWIYDKQLELITSAYTIKTPALQKRAEADCGIGIWCNGFGAVNASVAGIYSFGIHEWYRTPTSSLFL